MFDVVGEGLDAFQLGLLGTALEDGPVVEVGFCGQRHERRPGGANLVGEACPGDDSDIVAPLDEPLRDREQRREVAMYGNAGDDDR